jgi:hypothetical protein
VKAERADGAVAVGRLHGEVLGRYLPHQALGGGEDLVQALGQDRGREALAFHPGDADQRRQRLRIPPVHGPVADDRGRHDRDVEPGEIRHPLGLGLDVDAFEPHSP